MSDSHAQSILSPLQGPRRQLSRRRIVDGCLKLFACLSLAVLILQGVSWAIPIREKMAAALIFSCLVVTAGGVFLTWMRVLFRPPSLTRVARLVERSHPDFHDALMCAVQLTQKTSAPLNPVEGALLEDVREKLNGLDLSLAALMPRYSSRRMMVAGVIAVLLGVLAIRTAVFRKAFYAWSPGGERGLVVNPGDNELARGKDLVVRARVNRWAKSAVIEIAGESGARRYEMQAHGDSLAFTFYEVDTPFSYRVLTPDLASPWYRTDVYIPPAITEVTCQVTPPAYTGKPAVIYKTLTDCSMLEGSLVTLTASATVPGKIWLEENGQATLAGQAASDISGGGVPVTIRVTVNKQQSIRLFVEDAAGRKSQGQSAVFSVYPDAIPVVEVLSPKQDALLRPDESLLVEARAMDDFGLEDVTLHVSVGGRQVLTFPLSDGGGEVDLRLRRQLTSDVLGTEAGDVVAFFVTAKDSKRPKGQIGRSEIRFVEIRPDITPRDSKSGKQMPSLDVQRIIAELRRLITVTYGIMGPSGAPDGEDGLKLVTGLGDLRVLISRQMSDFRKQSGPTEAAAIEPWYKRGGEYVEEARRLARLPDFSLSVNRQEKALTWFTKLAQELMKNKSSKPLNKPRKGQGSGKSTQQNKSGKDPMTLAEAMKMMRQTQVELSRLADGQAAQNQRLSRFQKLSQRDLDELSRGQDVLAGDTDWLKKQLEKAGVFKDLTQRVGKAGAAMTEAAGTLKQNSLTQARRAGLQARMELLAAIRQTETGLRQLAARQISHLATQMNGLATIEKRLEKLSGEAGAKPSVPNEVRDALRDAQKKISDKTESVMQAARQLSDEMVESFPAAGQSLRQALAGKHARELTQTGHQAQTALLYKKFKKATVYQQKMATGMRALSQEMATAADQLPTVTPAELTRLLNQLRNTRAMLQNGAPGEQVKRSVNQGAEQLAEMGRQLNDLGFMELSGQLGEAVDRESQAGTFPETDRLLGAAGQLVSRQLRKSYIEEKETLTRKLARPPEKYRRQVEEYFKELSVD